MDYKKVINETTTLILVRHGETETNLNRKLHKAGDPKELNETGKEQVRKTAKKIREYDLSVIYSSKETRAFQSAEIIAQEFSLKVRELDGLQERDWGDFSGKTWPEIQAVLDKMTLEERFNYVPPNGESWKAFDERLRTSIDKVIWENKGKNVVIVSHGGAIRALMPYLLNVPNEESFKYDPDNASLTIFDYDGDKFIKRAVNNTNHLNS